MTSKKPSQCAMDKILQGEVKQSPKWHFVLKNIALWLVGLLCIVAGALTVSLIIFTFANSALLIRDLRHDGFWKHIIVVMPVLWFFITIVFLMLFKFLVRHTKRGYRYSLTIIMLFNLLFSIVGGVIFYVLGASHIVDDEFSKLKYYNSVEKRQGHLFNKPDHGMIAGRVMGCSDNYFTLVAPGGERWQVLNEHLSEGEKNNVVDGKVFIVMGKKIDENIFVACDVKLKGMKGEYKGVMHKRMDKMKHDIGEKEMMCDCEHMPHHLELVVQKACEDVKM